MTHDDVLLKATQELDQPLTASERVELDAHFRDCAECREEWGRMRAAHGALAAWGAVQTPAAGAPITNTPSSSRLWPWLAAASLVAALLGGGTGYAIGSGVVPSAGSAVPSGTTADTRPVFTLLLEEPAAAWPPASGEMRVGYVAWRDSLAASGSFAGGARFVPDAGWYVSRSGDALPTDALAAGTRPAPNYSGYFLVYASSYAEAVSIARGSPHLAYGGILVRGPAAP